MKLGPEAPVSLELLVPVVPDFDDEPHWLAGVIALKMLAMVAPFIISIP